VIILDVMLPDKKVLTSQGHARLVPASVLLLTARGEAETHPPPPSPPPPQKTPSKTTKKQQKHHTHPTTPPIRPGLGLRAGADDYLSKLQPTRACRQNRSSTPKIRWHPKAALLSVLPVLRSGEVELDPSARAVPKPGKRLVAIASYDLLRCLSSRRDRS